MNIVSAALKCKCPQCRQGNVFSSAAYTTKFFHMNETCSVCDVRLEPEPGFYQGAMYVSYGFTVMGLAIISLLLYYTWNPNHWIYIGTIIGAMTLLAPLNFRYSRILYLYLFGGIAYKPMFTGVR